MCVKINGPYTKSTNNIFFCRSINKLGCVRNKVKKKNAKINGAYNMNKLPCVRACKVRLAQRGYYLFEGRATTFVPNEKSLLVTPERAAASLERILIAPKFKRARLPPPNHTHPSPSSQSQYHHRVHRNQPQSAKNTTSYQQQSFIYLFIYSTFQYTFHNNISPLRVRPRTPCISIATAIFN